MQSKSVTRLVNFNKTKIGEKYQYSKNSNATFLVIFKHCDIGTKIRFFFLVSVVIFLFFWFCNFSSQNFWFCAFLLTPWGISLKLNDPTTRIRTLRPASWQSLQYKNFFQANASHAIMVSSSTQSLLISSLRKNPCQKAPLLKSLGLFC